MTISLDTPDIMARSAAEAVSTLGATLLKAKLGGGETSVEAARLEAVRAATPEARLIVDANEGWTAETLAALDPVCAGVGALFIEQPLPADQDAALDELDLRTPLCADESAHACGDFHKLVGKYDMINIKLDKTGGLTEALKLRDMARAEGMQVMVGCMLATSLAMAPATIVAQGAEVVDLDGPLLLAGDRDPALEFDGSLIRPVTPALWG